MIVNKASERQLKRLVETKGVEVEFISFKENAMGEPDYGSPFVVFKTKGVFRKTSAHYTRSTNENGNTVRSGITTPMILCLYTTELVNVLRDNQELTLSISETSYKAVRADNVQGLSICLDISLEEVINEFKV